MPVTTTVIRAEELKRQDPDDRGCLLGRLNGLLRARGFDPAHVPLQDFEFIQTEDGHDLTFREMLMDPEGHAIVCDGEGEHHIASRRQTIRAITLGSVLG